MLLFPETFLTTLVWLALGFVALDVIALALLWLADAKKGELW
jgi:hypothetical protein